MPDIEGVPYEAAGTALDVATAQALAARHREAISAGVAAGTEAKALAQSVVADVSSIRTAVAQSANSASAAAGSAAQAEQTATDLVPRVEHIEAMAGLAPGDVTDAQTANLITQPDTQARAALDAASVEATEAVMGLVLAGAAFDQLRLQEAATVAEAHGKRLVAAGTVSTTQPLDINSNCDLGELTINYSGPGPAVRVGKPTASLMRRQGTLPRVVSADSVGAGTWVAGQVGIQLINNDSCIWVIPHVKNFAVGVEEVGDTRGHAYNTVTFGHLENNKVNHRIRATGNGWANQNTHSGGRFGHNSGEGTAVPGCRHVEMAASGNALNNNTWLGTSFEGNAPEFHADISGTANMFLNCRWEASSGPKVRWQAGAVNNQILYGYNANTIVETHEAGATRNHIFTATQMRIQTAIGTIMESSAGNTGVVDAIMAGGGMAAGTDPATGYTVKRTANATHMKRATDASDRAKFDHVNGRFYFGAGTADPTVYIGAYGNNLGIGGLTLKTTGVQAGAATALPSAPAGYLPIYLDGTLRHIAVY